MASMSKEKAFARLKGSLTDEQKAAARKVLTLGQITRLAFVTPDTFGAFHDGLSEEQRETFRGIMTPEQEALADVLVAPATKSETETPKRLMHESVKDTKPMPATIEQLADAIPRHLRYKDKSNPWGITESTLEDYNRVNGTNYGAIDLLIRGREVATWLLTKIRNVLTEAKNGIPPTADAVVLGYLVGWAELLKAIRGEEAREPSQYWRRMAAAIVADAESGSPKRGGTRRVPKPAPAPSAPTSPAKRLMHGSPDWKLALWGLGSIVAFPITLALWRRKNKRG